MKIVKKKSSENCHFNSHEKSLYVVWVVLSLTVKTHKAYKISPSTKTNEVLHGFHQWSLQNFIIEALATLIKAHEFSIT